MTAERHRSSIREATYETLSAINIQIALFIYMATFIDLGNRVFEASFSRKMPLNLGDETMTEFSSSAMMHSFIAGNTNFLTSYVCFSSSGIISLTFAQFKNYMTRHAQDAEVKGKIVYLLACTANSLLIFLNQVSYYAIGLPYFTSILIIIIRLIVRFDEYGELPDNSDPHMMVLLVLVVVLLPMKFIPVILSKMLKQFSEGWILQETAHMNKRNRSGYGVTGYNEAGYMFLPSARNCHKHLNDSGASLNPGFFYFSKDPLSRRLYRLRFETQVFCKVAMHFFFLAITLAMLSTIHLVLDLSTVAFSTYLFEVIEWVWVRPLLNALTLGTIPLLLLSFGLLHLYYTVCHPWRSEGVSVGFQPNDQETWKPFSHHPNGWYLYNKMFHHNIQVVKQDGDQGCGIIIQRNCLLLSIKNCSVLKLLSLKRPNVGDTVEACCHQI